eukprot:CAMPEP_0194069218 /NCGR_PEP_ID=MMETSP0009_2-20130614/87523_1 /TAXON_ID=210454 /ORGANISM="Grammatophora oceanica, Strain CCMP 410" /LENGTH=55 /DNA_ID=CAMNT_0038722391 /DNA_START=148 /DNA_END=315 /DNA_ORIENTATION=+
MMNTNGLMEISCPVNMTLRNEGGGLENIQDPLSAEPSPKTWVGTKKGSTEQKGQI